MVVENKKWKTSEAVSTYQKEVFGNKLETTFHDLAHIIAAGLTNPDHIMDMDWAKNKIPPKRFAGYESEPIAILYSWVIEKYPTAFRENIFSEPERAVKEILELTKDFDKKQIWRDLIEIENNNLPDYNRSMVHNKHRMKYAKSGAEAISHPSHREMMHHFAKAIELCDNFHQKTGLYPSDIAIAQIDNPTNIEDIYHEKGIKIPEIMKDVKELGDIPLELFSINNIYSKAKYYADKATAYIDIVR